jgi:hypothetical protein
LPRIRKLTITAIQSWVTADKDAAGAAATSAKFNFGALKTMDGMSVEEQKVRLCEIVFTLSYLNELNPLQKPVR